MSIQEVECSANRGREYKVTFDAVGSVQRVEVKVWIPNGLRKYTWRRLWRDDGRQSMTATVSCAIHSARARIEREGSAHAKDSK